MKVTLLLFILLAPSAAVADRVTVKGTVLEGTVKSLSDESVVMSTIYGKGALTIPTKDVSAIETDEPFHFYKDDGERVIGRVLEISPEAVTLETPAGGSTEISFEETQAAPRDAGAEASWVDRQRVENPWWRGNLDLSYNATQGTTDTSALGVALGATRERGPNRTRFGASYNRGTKKERFPDPGKSGRRDVTSNDVRGWVRQEHDVSEHVYVFGSFEAEHDGVDDLSLRLISKLGAGYQVVETDTAYLAFDIGPSYLWEDFYDDTENDFFALGFGVESRLKLPWNNSSWYAQAEYLPAIDEWTDDYRLRGETGFLVPLVGAVNFKASVINEYNSQPAEDTASNTLRTMVGLSVVY
jgi:putative salt-induced outer membrane protein YdiY